MLSKFKKMFLDAFLEHEIASHVVLGGSFVLCPEGEPDGLKDDNKNFAPKDLNFYCKPEHFESVKNAIKDVFMKLNHPMSEKTTPYYFYISDNNLENNVFEHVIFSTSLNERITLTEHPILLYKTIIFNNKALNVMLLSMYISSVFIGIALGCNLGYTCVDKNRLIGILDFFKETINHLHGILIQKLGAEANVQL